MPYLFTRSFYRWINDVQDFIWTITYYGLKPLDFILYVPNKIRARWQLNQILNLNELEIDENLFQLFLPLMIKNLTHYQRKKLYPWLLNSQVDYNLFLKIHYQGTLPQTLLTQYYETIPTFALFRGRIRTQRTVFLHFVWDTYLESQLLKHLTSTSCENDIHNFLFSQWVLNKNQTL